MKKLLFIAVISLMTSVVCNANYVLIKNNTNCIMSVSLNGGGGYQLVYPLSTLTINSSLNITAAKVIAVGDTQQLNVDFYHPFLLSAYPPPCIINQLYYCKWNQGSITSNVLLDISLY